MSNELIYSKSLITRLKQRTLDLERMVKSLKNQLKKSKKENKFLRDQNLKLTRRLGK